MSKPKYTVVVRDPNSWSPITGERHIIRACGHAHKTPEAAQQCLAKLRDANYRTGSWACNANWYLADVEVIPND